MSARDRRPGARWWETERMLLPVEHFGRWSVEDTTPAFDYYPGTWIPTHAPPRGPEVYCVTCPTCGVEWSVPWPPGVGLRLSDCGHLSCNRSVEGRICVYENGEGS